MFLPNVVIRIETRSVTIRVRPYSKKRKREKLILSKIDQFWPLAVLFWNLGGVLLYTDEKTDRKTDTQSLKTLASDLSIRFHTAELYISPSRINSALSYSGARKFGAVIVVGTSVVSEEEFLALG